MIGVDWIVGLPTTEGWFNMIQNHVDLLSEKVHAVPTPWQHGRRRRRQSWNGSCRSNTGDGDGGR
jgi:hypothetical protein